MVRARGDFDGDGKQDIARVLVRRDAPEKMGVFVFLADARPPAEAEQLDKFPLGSGEYMLYTVRKGCYRSPQRTICLNSAGLMRSEIEYGWGTLYWMKNGKWMRTTLARGEFEGL